MNSVPKLKSNWRTRLLARQLENLKSARQKVQEAEGDYWWIQSALGSRRAKWKNVRDAKLMVGYAYAVRRYYPTRYITRDGEMRPAHWGIEGPVVGVWTIHGWRFIFGSLQTSTSVFTRTEVLV